MTLNAFLDKLKQTPSNIEFIDTMAIIDHYYEFTPTQFSNGETQNKAGENNGSCKIFAFGQLNNLSEQLTLACFGHYYRHDVLNHPESDDHQNIRQFMQTGWQGIKFSAQTLQVKQVP